MFFIFCEKILKRKFRPLLLEITKKNEIFHLFLVLNNSSENEYGEDGGTSLSIKIPKIDLSQRQSNGTKEENFDEFRPNFIRPTPILPQISNNYFSDISAIAGSHIFGK